VKAIIFVAALLVCVSIAHAAPYDGSAPMTCTIQAVMVCNEPSACTRGTAQTINFPPAVTVDVANRLISGAATGRTPRLSLDRALKLAGRGSAGAACPDRGSDEPGCVLGESVQRSHGRAGIVLAELMRDRHGVMCPDDMIRASTVGPP